MWHVVFRILLALLFAAPSFGAEMQGASLRGGRIHKSRAFSIIVIGDMQAVTAGTATRMQYAEYNSAWIVAQRAIADIRIPRPIAAVIQVGDLVNNGNYQLGFGAGFINSNWSNAHLLLDPPRDAGIAVITVPGNHDADDGAYYLDRDMDRIDVRTSLEPEPGWKRYGSEFGPAWTAQDDALFHYHDDETGFGLVSGDNWQSSSGAINTIDRFDVGMGSNQAKAVNLNGYPVILAAFSVDFSDAIEAWWNNVLDANNAGNQWPVIGLIHYWAAGAATIFGRSIQASGNTTRCIGGTPAVACNMNESGNLYTDILLDRPEIVSVYSGHTFRGGSGNTRYSWLDIGTPDIDAPRFHSHLYNYQDEDPLKGGRYMLVVTIDPEADTYCWESIAPNVAIPDEYNCGLDAAVSCQGLGADNYGFRRRCSVGDVTTLPPGETAQSIAWCPSEVTPACAQESGGMWSANCPAGCLPLNNSAFDSL